jgi:hypothetical protein
MEANSAAAVKPKVRVDPATALPADWDRQSDVVFIAGEGGTALAAPFVAHGTKRVVVYLPEGCAPTQPESGATIVRSRAELTRYLNLIGAPPIGRYATIRSPWCRQSVGKTDALFKAFVQLVKRGRGNQKVSDEFGPLWAANGVRNLPSLGQCPMASDLVGILQGTPVIIVGAGPSLDKNIHLLKAAKDKAVIISVSRALRTLQAAGVTPDIAVVLEPQQVAYQFDGIDVGALAAVAVDVTVNPNLFDVPARRFIGFVSNAEAMRWMVSTVSGVTELATGGSVSCSAMSLALRMGAGPVILVGQDLSFSGGDYYASNGVDAGTRAVLNEDGRTFQISGFSDEMAQAERFQAAGAAPTQGAATAPGYFGGTVPTSLDFAHYRLWFENTALDHIGRVEMFNCTEGGAFIGGMSHRPLAEVLAGLPGRTVDVGARIDGCAKPDREPALRELAHAMHRDLPSVIRLAQRCVNLLRRAERTGRLPKDLAPTEAALRQALASVQVVSLLGQSEIRAVLAQAAQAKTPKAALGFSRRLYSLIAQEAPKLLAPVQDAVDRFTEKGV